MTSSQMRDAMAWIHFPGQSSESAVCVIDPRRPKRRPEGHMSATNGECNCIYEILMPISHSVRQCYLLQTGLADSLLRAVTERLTIRLCKTGGHNQHPFL